MRWRTPALVLLWLGVALSSAVVLFFLVAVAPMLWAKLTGSGVVIGFFGNTGYYVVGAAAYLVLVGLGCALQWRRARKR